MRDRPNRMRCGHLEGAKHQGCSTLQHGVVRDVTPEGDKCAGPDGHSHVAIAEVPVFVVLSPEEGNTVVGAHELSNQIGLLVHVAVDVGDRRGVFDGHSSERVTIGDGEVPREGPELLHELGVNADMGNEAVGELLELPELLHLGYMDSLSCLRVRSLTASGKTSMRG